MHFKRKVDQQDCIRFAPVNLTFGLFRTARVRTYVFESILCVGRGLNSWIWHCGRWGAVFKSDRGGP